MFVIIGCQKSGIAASAQEKADVSIRVMGKSIHEFNRSSRLKISIYSAIPRRFLEFRG
jgi:hypothetical protein